MSFIAGATARSLSAVQTDKAGNISAASSGQAVLGTSGADTLTGSPGNDLLAGAAGADTFTFGASFGQDIIGDFAPGGAAHDIINFHGIAALNNFANMLSHTVAAGTGVVISLDASNSLTLNNIAKGNLIAADFSFA
jgi:Ca2+-binding RTX toxin-like protein